MHSSVALEAAISYQGLIIKLCMVSSTILADAVKPDIKPTRKG